jgi:dihydrolipoamide dehydrogenase
MHIEKYDLVVLGGGPGGYTAAINGAQKGLKTLLAEEHLVGGTCLNRGCIPTKTLLEHTLMIRSVRRCPFLKGDMKINLKKILERKKSLVENSRSGIMSVLAENGVKRLEGKASFSGPKTVSIETADGVTEVKASHIILATGAKTVYGPDLEPDGKRILSTDQALALNTIPKTLAVMGGGNRGLEFAAIYHNLGVRVVVIEENKRILPRFHWELADRYKRTLLEKGIKVLTGSRISSVDASDDRKPSVTLETPKGEKTFSVDQLLLTGDRRPDFEDLNLPAAGISTHEGILSYGPGMETEVAGIYVVGDAAGGPYRAHKAISQGLIAVNHILDKDAGEDPLHIPDCLYGDPEVAAVGLTEDEALEAGRKVKMGAFNFVGNGRAGTLGKPGGTVMVMSDVETDEILGVHMIGPGVTELIAAAALALQNKIDLKGFRKTVFPHPTLSEALFEAALGVDGQAIHLKVEGELFSD